MPEDRIVVSNVHRNGCRLQWKESKDNGGLPIEYIVEKYVVAADVWSNYAQLSGTSIDVNDLETGREYAFAVKAVNAEGESDALPTAKTMLAKDAFSKLYFIIMFHMISGELVCISLYIQTYLYIIVVSSTYEFMVKFVIARLYDRN